MNDVTETAGQVRIDTMTRRYRELKQLIADAQQEADTLNGYLKDYIRETGEIIECEGLLPLRLKRRSVGIKWDSAAIAKIQEDSPFLWERLRELGAVSLKAAVMREAVKNGQLMGLPPGGVDDFTEVLVFEK